MIFFLLEVGLGPTQILSNFGDAIKGFIYLFFNHFGSGAYISMNPQIQTLGSRNLNSTLTLGWGLSNIWGYCSALVEVYDLGLHLL